MPDRYVFIRGAFCLGLLPASLPAPAQPRPSLTLSGGPAFFMKPHWFSARNGNAFIQGAAPTGKLVLEWPTARNERLHLVGFARNGWWATESVSRYDGYGTDWGGTVYQLGGGLRYVDFLNLGRWLEPFVGLTASLGLVRNSSSLGTIYVPNVPDARRWTALLGAEIGVQGWISPRSGPTLTLEIHQSLLRYCPNFTTTEYLRRDPQPPLVYELRSHALRGQAALLLGWHWQLGAGQGPRPRWRTPRYSEPPPAADEPQPPQDATD